MLGRNITACGFNRQAVVHAMKAEDFLRRSLTLPRYAGAQPSPATAALGTPRAPHHAGPCDTPPPRTHCPPLASRSTALTMPGFARCDCGACRPLSPLLPGPVCPRAPWLPGGGFDFVSCCPPYLLVSYPELMGLLDRSPLIKPSSIVFVEYPKQLAHEVREGPEGGRAAARRAGALRVAGGRGG